MIQAKKTNAPKVKDAWLISVRYCATRGIKGITKIAYEYETERDALLEAEIFRHSLESSSRGMKENWEPFCKKSEADTREMLMETKDLQHDAPVQYVHS